MTAAPDWDKPREFLGHAVENGVIRHLSVSSLEKAAPRRMGCFRRWFYRYVLGDKEPEKESSKVSKRKGTEMHDRLAHYLSTGEMILQAPEIKGKHMLPEPGPDLWVEQKFHRVEVFDRSYARKLGINPIGGPDQEVRITSSLHAAGIPLVGYIDLAHGRLRTWTEDDGHIVDPVGTFEVLDHKFKSNAKDKNGNSTLLLPGELVQTIQMAGYGRVIANTQPSASHVRLSLLYYPEKGDKPRKVTRLHVLDDCVRTWEYVDGVARTLVDVAKETDVNRVDGNVQACDALGGCPYREKCSKYQTTSLDNLWGKVASDFTKESTMGIISSNPQIIQQQPAQQPGYQASQGQWSVPPGVPQPQQYAPTQTAQQFQQQYAPAPQQPDMRAQLATEEAQMKAQQAQQQAQLPQVQQPNFVEMCSRLQMLGRGMPTLAGAAAMAYAAAGGQSISPGQEYPGFGEFISIRLTEPAHVIDFASQVLGQQQQPAPVTAVVQQAAPQQMNFTQQVAQAYNAQVPPTQQVPMSPAGGILAPGTPESQPQLAQQQAAPAQPQVPAGEAPKGRRGRPKKNDSGTAPEAAGPAQQPAQTAVTVTTPSAQPTPAQVTVATQVTPAQAPTSSADPYLTGITQKTEQRDGGQQPMILINARSLSIKTTSLAGYVDYINEKLAKMYNTTKSGEQGPLDVRAAVEGSILGYGGWKGCVRECVKADPPPPGAYHLDTNMSELYEAVADGLRPLEARGWLYIRGMR